MKVLVITLADVARCPIRSLAASHYFRLNETEVRCRCTLKEGES